MNVKASLLAVFGDFLFVQFTRPHPEQVLLGVQKQQGRRLGDATRPASPGIRVVLDAAGGLRLLGELRPVLGDQLRQLEVAGETVYTATKAAINSYTKVLAKEIYKSGITVNAIAPSAIETDLSAQINKDTLMEVLAKNAIPQYGKMSDVSNLTDFLIREESSAITGQIIYLGGV